MTAITTISILLFVCSSMFSVVVVIVLFILKSKFKTYYVPVKNYIYKWINYIFRWLYIILHPIEFLGVKTKQLPCDSKYDDDGVSCWSKPGYIQKIRNPPQKYGCDKYDSRFRDDGTSCWLDTYANGVGTIPLKRGCYPGQRDDGTSCWEDLKCNPIVTTGGGCHGGDCHWDGCCNKGAFGECYGCARCNPITCDPINTTGGDCHGCGCIKKALWDRQYCADGQSNVAGLCYPNCRQGYHYVGGNLCEPDNRPGIKKTLFDRQYCPENQHMDGLHAFCYDNCNPGWHSDGALACVKDENALNTIIPEIKVDLFSRQTCADTTKYKLGPGNILCYPIFPSIPIFDKNETQEIKLDTGY